MSYYSQTQNCGISNKMRFEKWKTNDILSFYLFILQLYAQVSAYIRMMSTHAQGILVLDSNTISTGFIVTVSYCRSNIERMTYVD
jgi:hypothetical protein